jgi:two-component sensor histidine kinase
MNILVIDDDSDDRALIAGLIKKDHPESAIFHVDSGVSVDRHLQRDDFDLAITERALSWGSGLDICRRIKAVCPDCGVIMYSNAAGEDYAVEAMKAGLDDYIVKGASHQSRLRTSIHALLLQGEQRRKMRLTQRRYDELFQRVTVGLFTCNTEGMFFDANPALLAMLGVNSLADLSGWRFGDVFSGDDLPRNLADLPPSGISDVQVRVRSYEGKDLAAFLNAYPSLDGDNRIQGVVTNVSALRKALDEKTTLLREVYHRVYNNLQLVISLLGMQSRQFAPDIQSVFQDVMDRVRSLSLIQQKLYRTEDYSAVDFSAYLRDLAGTLIPPRRAPDISIVYDLAPLLLPIDKAVPLGLIANELLMNAMRHAFPGARRGEIRVRVDVRPEKAMFSVADDGVGIDPAGMSTGVGSRLIHHLAQQAGATVTMNTEAGFATTVEFDRGENP